MTKNVYVLTIGELHRVDRPPVISRVFEDIVDACKYVSEKTGTAESELLTALETEGLAGAFLYKEGQWYEISEHVMELHN